MGNEKNLSILIMLTDIIVLMITVVGTYSIFSIVTPHLNASTHDAIMLAMMFVVSYMASYSLRPPAILKRIVKFEQIIRRVFTTSTLMILITSTLIFVLTKGRAFPRIYIGTIYIVFTILLTIERILIHKSFRLMYLQNKNKKNIVLIGSEDTIARLYQTLSHPSYGYNIVGVFYDETNVAPPLSEHYLGTTTDFFAWLSDNKEDVQEIYGYFPKEEQNMINIISKVCDNNLIRFFYVPAIDVYNGNISISYIENIPVIARRKEPLADPVNKVIKRTFDIVASLIFLIVLFPWIFIFVTIGIKLSSPGPIFFLQNRTGLNGKIFKCIKFRTMHVNKDSDRLQATKDDPRKFAFGNLLRKTNLDEMPQFINVLLGSMSIVGPRPHMLLHTEEYSRIVNRFMLRHLAKPGITGLAQVTGFRGETKYVDQMENRVKKDIEYIENWTFLLDLKIIFLTAKNMLCGEKNAY